RASRLFAASPAKCDASPALAQGTEARRYFACLWLKLLNRKGLAGASPHPPSLTCDAARAGGTAQKARAYHPARGQSVFFGRAARGIQKDL
ncbi:TPA: hypothetical protein ACKUHH_002182, partial [Neisseria gonorrhoeae]